MMLFKSIDGSSMFVDPLSIQVVAPAFAPPPAGVPGRNVIPTRVGSTLILNGFNVAVQGDTAEVAAEVTTAKAEARAAAFGRLN